MKLTVTFNHEWLDDIMPNHLKVRVANPMTDGSSRTGKEVVQYGDLMAQKHKTINEMRAYEASTSSDEDALAVRRSEKLYGRESGEGRVRD